MVRNIKLYVYIIGIPDNAFSVTVAKSDTVEILERAIFNTKPKALRNFEIGQLPLYPVPLPDDGNLEQTAPQALDPTDQRLRPLRLNAPSRTMSEIFSQKPQEGTVSIVVDIRSVVVHGTPHLEPAEPTRPEFTMKLRALARWDRLDDEDLHYNHVGRVTSSSPYIQQLQERLRRKRYIDDATEDFYMKWQTQIPLNFLNSFFERVVRTETDTFGLDYVTQIELINYCDFPAMRDMAKYRKAKEAQVWCLLLPFSERLELVPDSSWGFRSDIPFHLMINVRQPKENLKYTLRSDFHMRINNFPHLILQVNSKYNESDQYRMLLQASCFCRIGNWLRGSTNQNPKPIIILAIYVDNNFQALQHLVYQPDRGSSKVEYITTKFDLTVAKTAFEFKLQLYNFLSAAVEDNASFYEPYERLIDAKASVGRRGLSSFSKRRHEEEAKNNKSTNSSRSPTPGGSRDSFDNPSVERELSREGYTLTQLPKELSLLTPLKPTIRKATSRSGVSVVLKTIVDSNERRLLEYLSSIKAPSNHTIPLLDAIDLSIGKTIIVLPWKSPLDEILRFHDRPTDVPSLCLQFIEGVDFLHSCNVAHRDLKPRNIVIDKISEPARSPRLFIIDFDLAQSVESQDTMIEDWCGTPPWIAPELGSRDGPTQRYNPILADRWVCGRMIEYFTQYFPPHEDGHKKMLLEFASRLLDVNPRARPELNKLPAIDGPAKRKSARNQHEPAPKRHATQV